MKRRVTFGLLVSASVLLVVATKLSLCKEPSAENAANVTVSELAIHPQKYDGKLVCINAVAVYGLEGDNFLIDPSKPFPLDIPSRQDPASLWFYSKQLYSMLKHQPPRVDEESEERTSDCHDFEGHFHFVDKPQMVGVFYPGSLQLECLGSCPITDSQPHSLAAVTRSGDIDETRRILRSNVDLRDKYKNLLLFLAVNTNQSEFAEELLASGADARFTRSGGDTALMAAAWRDDTKTARLLLDHGVAVNATNTQGETALMVAIHSCWVESLACILKPLKQLRIRIFRAGEIHLRTAGTERLFSSC